jgi:hypothetical protein
VGGSMVKWTKKIGWIQFILYHAYENNKITSKWMAVQYKTLHAFCYTSIKTFFLKKEVLKLNKIIPKNVW